MIRHGMQQREGQTNSHELPNWKITTTLWKVICSTIVTNPAEQGVVRQVIGDALIQESASLYRESVALHDILLSLTGDRDSCDPRLHAENDSSLFTFGTACPPQSIRRKDATPSTPSLCIVKDQRQGRAALVGSSKPLKISHADVNVRVSRSKHKHSDVARNLTRLRKPVGNRDGTGITSNQETTHQKLQGSISSSTSTSAPNIVVKRASMSYIGCDRLGDNCANSILATDYMSIVHEKQAQINAYDIDEIVHELRDAFASERVYLNHLVERLRRDLEESIDSCPTAHIDPKDIQNNDKVLSRVERSEPCLSAPMQTLKDVRQRSQRPASPSGSRRSLARDVQNLTLASASFKPTSGQLQKANSKQTDKLPLKHVVPRSKIQKSLVTGRKILMS